MSKKIEVTVNDEGKGFEKASKDFKFASAVAGFGMILRESQYKGNATLSAVREWAQEGLGEDSGGYRAEILRYVDLTSQDTTHHFAVGQLRLEFSRLLVKIREDFAHTTDPPGTELTGRIKSDTNVLAPEVEYGITQRLSVGANYSWTHEADSP